MVHCYFFSSKTLHVIFFSMAAKGIALKFHTTTFPGPAFEHKQACAGCNVVYINFKKLLKEIIKNEKKIQGKRATNLINLIISENYIQQAYKQYCHSFIN